MVFAVLPPELRSLCRRLTATKVEQLPALLPLLLKDILRCQEPLSKPQEAKTSDNSSESAVLVHKLKTQVSSLLNSRVTQGRFVGVVLVKAVVEAGGWECLRTSESWVRGLLSILQRKDPAVVKDLCIVTLVKIYTSMHAYPTLVREIVTPTLPTFATACLQILKPPASSKAAKIPNSLVETIFEALSTILPLYPTTLRQFASKIRAGTRPYTVPTISDGMIVPASLQASSRRLAIRLHMTAVKGGDSSEWAKHLDGLIRSFYATAEQVLRAVQIDWSSIPGHAPKSQNVDFDKELQGGGTNPDQLPAWTGLYAGSERMIGLLDFIGEYLRCRAKTVVTIPFSSITGAIGIISSIIPPIPGNEKSTSIIMNPAVGREEKDELWTVFPDIQLAAMRLLLVAIQRLRRNIVPVAQESLEQLVRMFESNYRLPETRIMTFILTRELLQLCGPTLPKLTVESLSLVVKACCRDLLGSAGHLKRPKQTASAIQNGLKNTLVSQNADAFLGNGAEDESISVALSADHVSAAGELLTTLFSHLPQQYIPSSLRAYMLKTAILCQNKDAQVASVLHPARDKSGRTPQVILPYLTQQFSHDDSVEILRFNFRPFSTGLRDDIMEIDDAIVEDEPEEKPPSNDISFGQPFVPFAMNPSEALAAAAKNAEISRNVSPVRPVEVAVKAPNPFVFKPSETIVTSEEEYTIVTQPTPANSLKRKNEDADIAVSKRIEVDTETSISASAPTELERTLSTKVNAKSVQEDSDKESDNESIHLNMELDSDEEASSEGDDD
ncbi:uncharacterized protein F4822DRAFT_12958 [Hypoxylon trugodes]|uniref:uncharacterized protein n=1 Tax=Hypoxylon trugodes TaxID=326681 RepID=UPI00218F0219|nr:uncharacterized protein F4822DRAFT_12958 [Hypoxylon trugodes]KAI1393439.1 hypothetical protein F4822DRAFT_12958 [Hypoxylon trugodes]